ncbi:MAG: hypothetical protein ACR2PL_14840, partial [Dehalococcoidia bacterium]
MDPEPFPGFRAGSRATVIPDSFFTRVLPEIEDPAELIVSWYIFFALGRQSAFPRSVTAAALAAEPPLIRALSRLPGGPEDALQRGLSRSVSRGVLLVARGSPEDDGYRYLLN